MLRRKGIAEDKAVHAESLGEKEERNTKKMQIEEDGRGYISTCRNIFIDRKQNKRVLISISLSRLLRPPRYFLNKL